MLGILLGKVVNFLVKKGFPLYGRKKSFYQHIPFASLMQNWWHQRIIGRHYQIPISVHFTSKVTNFQNIEIENFSPTVVTSFAVSSSCYIGVTKNAKLFIGEGSMFGYNCIMATSMHDPYDNLKAIEADIHIGRHCTISANVCITSGVTLGDNVYVGANTVVTKSFPSNVIIAGSPARIIKQLDPDKFN
jgi:acetyltransferase-like isoleucine patch superfamily enzyme